MSVVVPAYNEQDRLCVMLTEAVGYLEQEYGTGKPKVSENGHAKPRTNVKTEATNGQAHLSPQEPKGWEILLISDGSTDRTVETALSFARDLGSKSSANIRVISLHKNRGKGGAVTHGMRHVRGKYAVFADADGASRFSDLGKLVEACQKVEDIERRGVAVGSRAHLVGTESVVTVSFVSPDSCDGHLINLALVLTKFPHALLSSHTSNHDTTSNRCHTRYPMWLQVVLPSIFALYNTIYAQRRLDL